MFSIDEKVVYPGHGVAKIARVVEKKVGGHITKFFELKLMSKDMTVLIPTDNVSSTGIRCLSSSDNIDTAFRILAQPTQKSLDGDSVGSNWNKRNKEYQFKLRTGDLIEICKIYRDLKNIAQYKELSFGERNLLQQVETLLAEEISAVKNFGEDKALEHLRSSVAHPVLNRAHISQSVI